MHLQFLLEERSLVFFWWSLKGKQERKELGESPDED
jgi:hypothetical protein